MLQIPLKMAQAASSSKMLQMAMKTGRTENKANNNRDRNKHTPKKNKKLLIGCVWTWGVYNTNG